MGQHAPRDGYLAGGTTVVTGAASGLGAAMVDRFAAQGMNIVALDIDGAGAEASAGRVRGAGGRAVSMRVDVADRESLAAAAALTGETFGGCTLLCANVGVQQFGAIDRLEERDWRWVLDVNVLGTIATVDAFLPLIRATPGPRHILITSSSAAYSPGIRMAAYTTTKYAVTGYGETLRLELAPEGIGVSILFPAGMMTTHLESSQKARAPEYGPMEFRREDIDAMKASRGIDLAAHVATADHAVRHLIDDLAANRRFIITHGAGREAIVDRFEDLLAAYDRAQEA